MTQTTRCPRCGATVPPGRTQCAACLVALGIEGGSADSEGDDEAPSRVRERRAPPPAPEELAADFPELEIRALLGEGGMGVVYRARHRQLERDVALKLLAPGLVDDPRFEERFLREARALARLDHPGIVRVHDFGRKGTRLYLVMEFVDGTNLRTLIKGGQLTSREALAIVPQICEALQYAHDEGVVHRDIKPENVLIDAKGRVKLADFGLAKLIGVDEPNRTASGVALGTAHYVAPEQLSTPRSVDHRADIYSLGVVFYEMLTGELPLGRFEAPSKRVQIDVRLDEIVLKSLERMPERRYQHAVDVKTDVDDVASHPQPIAAEADKPHAAKVRRAHEQGITLALYALAWIVIGIAFNYGAVAFFAASALLAVIAARDQARAAKRGEVRWTAARKLVAIALFPIGFALFFAGMVAFADADKHPYDSGFVDGEHSLEPVEALLSAKPDVYVHTRQASINERLTTIRVLTELDVAKFWRQRWLVFAGWAIWLAALSLPNWKRRSSALVIDGSLAMSSLLLAAIPLIAILFAMWLTSKFRGGPPALIARDSLSDPCELALETELGAGRVRSELLQVGYQVHTEFSKRLDAAGERDASKADVTGVRVLYADQPDEFRRLRVTWRGLERALPTVSVFLIERKDEPLLAVSSLGKLYSSTFVPPGDAWFEPQLALMAALRAD